MQTELEPEVHVTLSQFEIGVQIVQTVSVLDEHAEDKYRPALQTVQDEHTVGDEL